VRMERLNQDVHSAHVSEIGSEDEAEMEEYDVGEEDDDDDEEDYNAPDPSDLPPPGLGIMPSPKNDVPAASTIAGNPFANWLGAMASKTAPLPVVPPPVVVTAPPASSLPPPEPVVSLPVEPPVPPTPSFLSPMDFLLGKKPADVVPTSSETQSSAPLTSSKVASQKQKKKVEPVPQPDPKISILKRENEMEGLPDILASAPTVESLEAAAFNNSPQLSMNDIRQVIREELLQVNNSGLSKEEITKVVREELKTLMPNLEKTMQRSLESSVTKPLLTSIKQLSKNGITVDTDEIISSVCKSVDKPMREAFADSVKNVLIPTLESVTGQVFVQIAEHLEQDSVAKNENGAKELASISKQLTTMTTLVAQLTNEVQTLRSAVSVAQHETAAVSAAVAHQHQHPAPVVDKSIALRSEIVALLEREDYEAAFTKAVSASTGGLAVFCCSKADINSVLGGTMPKISQPILLCLMQQMGTALREPSTDGAHIQLALEWLQEIALSLQPSDPQIKHHAPQVLQQLVAGINARMAQGDPELRRPLQRLVQIVRGMQLV
jgi:hypothetical protein